MGNKNKTSDIFCRTEKAAEKTLGKTCSEQKFRNHDIFLQMNTGMAVIVR